MTGESLKDRFSAFCRQVELAVVIDHTGRAGNAFFLTVFDQHPQVLTCPWLHYAYSYLVTEFGGACQLDALEAHRFWTKRWYFRLAYPDMNADVAQQIRKLGGDPEAHIDRAKLREVFDAIVAGGTTIGRRELVLASYFSYAVATGRDLDVVRYVLLSDSISLRTERMLDGFSGRVVDHIVADAPHARLIHLERDPRAGFASMRHQFINSLGNMYGLRPGHYWRRLLRLVRLDHDWDSPFVFGFWLLYFAQAYRAIERKKKEYASHFTEVKNEDLNLAFRSATGALVQWLGVEPLKSWDDEPYVPTMVRLPWTGVGAYNSAYQLHRHGPLANDPDDVAGRVTGPNVYVTQRWRTRLSRNEVLILEWAFGRELEAFGYEFLTPVGRRTARGSLAALLRPLSGELPTARWIALGRQLGTGEFCSRIFFALTFPPFYVVSRLSLIAAVVSRRVLPA